MSEPKAAKKVLIVDDDRASRVLMRTMLHALEDPQCEIAEAIGGQQALHMIESGRPDLVLLDILMPDLDGVSICQAIKSNYQTRGIKILIVTARRDERMVRAGLLAGADDYLCKPFTRDQFLAVVKRLL